MDSQAGGFHVAALQGGELLGGFGGAGKPGEVVGAREQAGVVRFGGVHRSDGVKDVVEQVHLSFEELGTLLRNAPIIGGIADTADSGDASSERAPDSTTASTDRLLPIAVESVRRRLPFPRHPPLAQEAVTHPEHPLRLRHRHRR